MAEENKNNAQRQRSKFHIPSLPEGWLTMRQYADRIGVETNVVSRRITAGKIPFEVVEGVRCVNLQIVDPLFGMAQHNKTNENNALVDGDDDSVIPINTSRAEAERLEKIFKARRQSLEVDKAKGKLVDVEQVVKRVFELTRRTRDAMRAIPDRICYELASEVDPHKCQIILTREVMLALNQLCDAVVNPDANENDSED